MGSSIFLKLLRSQSQSAARIIPLINKPILSHPLFPSTSATSPFLTHLPESDSTACKAPFLVQSEGRDPTSDHCPCPSSLYFRSFSFGFFLNPNSSTGLKKTDVDGCLSDDSQTIWADSVKKKRKRKMNKHKLKKLRKRLRRKT